LTKCPQALYAQIGLYAYRAKLLEVTAFFDGVEGVDKTDLTDGDTHPLDL
jgi:hypothetical protein